MSSGEQIPDTSSHGDNQSSSATESISGVVHRLNLPNQNERAAAISDSAIETVMLSVDSVRKLVDIHDTTARAHFGDELTVITSSIMRDDLLEELTWERELELVTEFGPDFHLPTEYSVYNTMTKWKQERGIRDCMQGTEWFADQLAGYDTKVLVQAKGWLPWHFELCRKTMDRIDTDVVAYYCSEYKQRDSALNQAVRYLIKTLAPSQILLIGNQSERYLRKAPPQVTAAAGRRWRKKSGLFSNGTHNQAEHAHWHNSISGELARGQSMLSTFDTNKVNIHG